MHRTKPQTAAFGLTDSPVGLAAWIVEKMRAWSDCGGDIKRSFTKDEILTNVMIYWRTATIGSSMRMYRANSTIAPEQPARRKDRGCFFGRVQPHGGKVRRKVMTRRVPG
jgi:hypothetical protein